MYKTNPIFWPFLLIIDVFSFILFFPKRFSKIPIPKKILLIRIEELGDIILSFPLLYSLKSKFPNARIEVLCKEKYSEFIKEQGFTPKIVRSWIDSYTGFYDVISELRKENYDLILEPHADPRSNLIASLCSRYSVGFGFRGGGFFLNKSYPFEQISQEESLLKLSAHLGAKKVNWSLKSKPSKLNLKKPIICIHPGTARKEKQWQNWVLLARHLKGSIIITGSKEEVDIANNIAKVVKVTNFCGKTSIPKLVGIISKCDLVIAPDSAIIHIAHKQKIPLIAIFAKDDPKIWGYNDALSISLKNPNGKPNEITVDEVNKAIKKLL